MPVVFDGKPSLAPSTHSRVSGPAVRVGSRF